MKQKLKVLIASISIALTPTISAQVIKDIPESTIDYTETPFDWQHKNWLINSFLNENMHKVIRVKSPFYSTNTDKFFFSNGDKADRVPDFYTEDGWELWNKNFGFNKNGEPEKHKNYSYPYIILYNKVRGIARVIAYINQPPSTYNNIEITLSSSAKNNTIKPNIFSTFNPVGLIDHKYYASHGSALSNLYAHDRGQFIYTDIPVTYDPCISREPYILNIKINPIQNATIELAGLSVSTSTPVVDGSQYYDQGLLTSYLKEGNGLDIDNLGVLTYQNYAKIVSETDSERIAEAIYKTDGDSSINSLLGSLGSGMEIASNGASMIGQPLASSVLSYASQGLNFLHTAPSVTLDGFKLPDPPGYLTYGEIALKGNSRVDGSVRNMQIPLPGSKDSSGDIPGLFNLIEVPSAEVIAPPSTKYSYVSNDGYTYKGAKFQNYYGDLIPTFISFNLKQLGGALSPIAKKNGFKILVGIEARTERTSELDGINTGSKKPGMICGEFHCAETRGAHRGAIHSELVPFDAWDHSYGNYTVSMALPNEFYPLQQLSSKIDYRNFSLFLKIWLVPEHLLDDYQGDISKIDRQALSASAQMIAYPVKLKRIDMMALGIQTRVDLTNFKPKHHGFIMTTVNGRVGQAKNNQYKTNTNLRFDFTESELEKICPKI